MSTVSFEIAKQNIEKNFLNFFTQAIETKGNFSLGLVGPTGDGKNIFLFWFLKSMHKYFDAIHVITGGNTKDQYKKVAYYNRIILIKDKTSTSEIDLYLEQLEKNSKKLEKKSLPFEKILIIFDDLSPASLKSLKTKITYFRHIFISFIFLVQNVMFLEPTTRSNLDFWIFKNILTIQKIIDSDYKSFKKEIEVWIKNIPKDTYIYWVLLSNKGVSLIQMDEDFFKNNFIKNINKVSEYSGEHFLKNQTVPSLMKKKIEEKSKKIV